MNFIEAVKLLLDGKKIRVKNWYRTKYLQRHVGNSYVVLNQLYEQYTIKLDDMLLDWELYKEPPKLHSFEEALKALKEGKTIKRKSSTDEFCCDYAVNRISSNLPHQAEKFDGDKWVDISFTNDDILANDWVIINTEDK
jgi:hypothetical protein